MMSAKNKHAIDLDPSKVNSTVWATQEEVLAALQISRQYLWIKIERGQFPRPVKWKTRIFFDESEINQWIAARLCNSK